MKDRYENGSPSPDPKDDDDLLLKIFFGDSNSKKYDPCDWNDPRNCHFVDEVFDEEEKKKENND